MQTDYRKNPCKYVQEFGYGKNNELGVLKVLPYKKEILPYWEFRNPYVAKKSARNIYNLFQKYKQNSDLVGLDMARKYLQMGYTRAMRYAKHSDGKKYDSYGYILPYKFDREKYNSAQEFKIYLNKTKNDRFYKKSISYMREICLD